MDLPLLSWCYNVCFAEELSCFGFGLCFQDEVGMFQQRLLKFKDDLSSGAIKNVYSLKKAVKMVLKKALSLGSQERQQNVWRKRYDMVKHTFKKFGNDQAAFEYLLERLGERDGLSFKETKEISVGVARVKKHCGERIDSSDSVGKPWAGSFSKPWFGGLPEPCFNCGRMGHIARYCFFGRGRGGRVPGMRGRGRSGGRFFRGRAPGMRGRGRFGGGF